MKIQDLYYIKLLERKCYYSKDVRAGCWTRDGKELECWAAHLLWVSLSSFQASVSLCIAAPFPPSFSISSPCSQYLVSFFSVHVRICWPGPERNLLTSCTWPWCLRISQLRAPGKSDWPSLATQAGSRKSCISGRLLLHTSGPTVSRRGETRRNTLHIWSLSTKC